MPNYVELSSGERIIINNIRAGENATIEAIAQYIEQAVKNGTPMHSVVAHIRSMKVPGITSRG